MEIWKDYYKVLDVINSCISIEQLKGATRMLGYWFDKHMDYHVYKQTFKNHIQTKFNELGGDDLKILEFRTN